VNLRFYLERLTLQAQSIARLVEGVNVEQARWKPSPTEWSILEVINHLYDEEIEDFRTRLKLTLEDPKSPWPPNAPEAKVIERNYNSRDLAESLENFLDERTVSLEWLRHVEHPRWKHTHEIAELGALSAGDLLTSWVAHDLLHLRQLVELHYHYQRTLAQPFEIDYAGEW
jgi:hypothetical protein